MEVTHFDYPVCKTCGKVVGNKMLGMSVCECPSRVIEPRTDKLLESPEYINGLGLMLYAMADRKVDSSTYDVEFWGKLDRAAGFLALAAQNYQKFAAEHRARNIAQADIGFEMFGKKYKPEEVGQ